MQMITPKKVPQSKPPPVLVDVPVGDGVGYGVGEDPGVDCEGGVGGVGAGVGHCGAGVGAGTGGAERHCRRRESGTMPVVQAVHVPPVPAALSAQASQACWLEEAVSPSPQALQ